MKSGIGESAGTNLQNQVANVQLTSTVYDTQREAENKYRAEPRFHPARDSKITASAILESLNYLGVFVSIDHDTLVRQYKKKTRENSRQHKIENPLNSKKQENGYLTRIRLRS